MFLETILILSIFPIITHIVVPPKSKLHGCFSNILFAAALARKKINMYVKKIYKIYKRYTKRYICMYIYTCYIYIYIHIYIYIYIYILWESQKFQTYTFFILWLSKSHSWNNVSTFVFFKFHYDFIINDPQHTECSNLKKLSWL